MVASAPEANPILHEYFRSSASFRVRIALNLKGIEYQAVSYHLRRGEHRLPDYLALNPAGLVPTLELSGHAISQSLAIIELIDEIHPNPSFLPDNPLDRATVRSLAQMIACDIHPLNNLRVLNYLRENLGSDEHAVKQWYNHWLAQGFLALEAQLQRHAGRGLYCFGNAPSLADICLVPQCVNAAKYDFDIGQYPVIAAIFARCLSLPAVNMAMPSRQPDAQS